MRSSAGDMAIPHNISNLDKFVYIQGVARRNDKQTITIPVTAVDSLTNQIVCYADSTYIHIYVASDQSSRTSSEITIRYTKTS